MMGVTVSVERLSISVRVGTTRAVADCANETRIVVVVCVPDD